MPPPVFAFTSDSLTPDARFGAYHDLYSVGCDVVRMDGEFHAAVKAYRFDRMLVFERRLGGVGHGRDASRIRRDGFDHLTLHLLLSGELIAGPAGAERPVTPGEIVALDSSQSHRTRNIETHTISVSLARDQIDASIPDIRPFHGTILSRRRASVIADLILSFTRRYETLSAETSAQFGHLLGVLIAAALKGTPVPKGAIFEEQQPDLARRQRAEAYMDAHLGEIGLNADGIAAGIGVSRSVLYRCFAEDGGVARHIQQRRLGRVRNVLRRRSDSDKLATIAHAHGFANEQHLSRAFRAHFGQPPGQFRSTIEQLRNRKTPIDKRRPALSGWLVELY